MWLTVNFYESSFARTSRPSYREAEHQLRRIDAANRRFLSSLKTLATVRKLACQRSRSTSRRIRSTWRPLMYIAPDRVDAPSTWPKSSTPGPPFPSRSGRASGHDPIRLGEEVEGLTGRTESPTPRGFGFCPGREPDPTPCR